MFYNNEIKKKRVQVVRLDFITVFTEAFRRPANKTVSKLYKGLEKLNRYITLHVQKKWDITLSDDDWLRMCGGFVQKLPLETSGWTYLLLKTSRNAGQSCWV